MTVAAARFLPHFASAIFPGSHPEKPFRPLAGTQDEPQPRDRSDVQQAVDAALTEARAEFERIRASDHADHARQLGERERQIAEQTTDVIVERLAAGLATINETVGHHVARVLARFLESAVRERAIDELSETLAALLADGHATQIRISGPADLVERLRSVATTAGVSLEAVIGESADVRVTVDDTSIETRIRAWMERTLAAVGDGPDG